MRVNNGLTPQELEAYGISDVHDIVYNPSYDLLYQEELDPSLTGYERGVLTNRHCCKVSDEAAFCLIQRPYISKTLLT
ncbi:hypothetical protein RNQ46_18835, partial [Escherichia coli]|nr:hypothetical protein [Escherichia coli]